MKRFLLAALSVLSAVTLLVACGSSTIGDRMDRYVDKIERECDNYSEADWKKVSEKIDDFAEEFDGCRKELAPEQREKFVKAMGRFDRIAIRSGLKNLFDAFEDIPAYFEGLGDSED